MTTNEQLKKKIFFPYYINQSRLLDLYAILNDGYSEYEEITTDVLSEKNKTGKAEISTRGGFKLFNIGSSISGEVGKKEENKNENRIKKVQTVTSILSLVNKSLHDGGYFKEILDSKPGDFVCIPVTLQINSIKSLIQELSTLMKLMDDMKKAGITIDITTKEVKDFEKMMKAIQIMFEGEEVLFETDEFAITGNIIDANLYQAVRADIIESELTCFAQVRRVFPDGTELMRNTVFSKIIDRNSKNTIFEAMGSLVEENVFSFEAIAVPSITNKPVYQLEIIALYQ